MTLKDYFNPVSVAIGVAISIATFSTGFWSAHSEMRVNNLTVISQIREEQKEHEQKIKSIEYLVALIKSDNDRENSDQNLALRRLEDTMNQRMDKLQEQMRDEFRTVNNNIRKKYA
jgi:hypothetical protein